MTAINMFFKGLVFIGVLFAPFVLVVIVALLVGCAKKPATVEFLPTPPPAQEAPTNRDKTFRDLKADAPADPQSLPIVYFDFDSYEIRFSEMALLREIYDGMMGRECVIEGHTCPIGEGEYNQSLGEHRAATVYNWLRSAGAAADKMAIITYGETRPVTTDSHKLHLNRRVEINCK